MKTKTERIRERFMVGIPPDAAAKVSDAEMMVIVDSTFCGARIKLSIAWEDLMEAMGNSFIGKVLRWMGDAK